jgi:hypothetical protein
MAFLVAGAQIQEGLVNFREEFLEDIAEPDLKAGCIVAE